MVRDLPTLAGRVKCRGRAMWVRAVRRASWKKQTGLELKKRISVGEEHKAK